MTHEQLYYPSLTPRITPKLAISLLHWDKVVRIFPREGTAQLGPSGGVIADLENEGILVAEPVDERLASHASRSFVRIAEVADGPQSAQQAAARKLVRPFPRHRKSSEYLIYRGKAHEYLVERCIPKYFNPAEDHSGNAILYCTRQTGLTYMTLLACFLSERRQFVNTATDSPDAFPLFIALNSYLHGSATLDSSDFVPLVRAAEEVERIFFVPLYKVLQPRKFEGEQTIEKILRFRQDTSNDQLRKGYLGRIDSFLSDLKECRNDEQVNEVVQQHERQFEAHLKTVIAACEGAGIPVNKRIVVHGRLSGWEVAGRLWDATCTVRDVVTYNALAVIKPLLKLKPNTEFYNRVLKKNDDFYPLLIQETFAPTRAQEVFARVRQLIG